MVSTAKTPMPNSVVPIKYQVRGERGSAGGCAGTSAMAGSAGSGKGRECCGDGIANS